MSDSGSRRSSSSSRDGGVVFLDVQAPRRGGVKWDFGDIGRSADDTPVRYAHDGVSRRIGPTQKLGKGYEASVYKEGRTALKAFKYGDAPRDDEFTALQRLDKRVPGMVPKPFSKGTVTMEDGSKMSAMTMETVKGKSIATSGKHRLDTPELSKVALSVHKFERALKATDTIWDATPHNILRTDKGYRFIDVKTRPKGLPYEKSLTHDTLTMLAKRGTKAPDKLFPVFPATGSKDAPP
ncbi:MAG: hypothetical protein JNM52_06430, partial [Betaproteobacteria bacterium]|nr:hypothetical protein [Betaproteobacteria bacterium]